MGLRDRLRGPLMRAAFGAALIGAVAVGGSYLTPPAGDGTAAERVSSARVSDMFASPAPGASAVPAASAPRIEGPSMIDVAWRLGLVLVGMYLLARVARRFLPRGMQGARDTGRIRVVERVVVSQSGHLAIVEVDGARLLVGITPQQVSLVADISDVPAAPARPFEEHLT